MVYFGGALLLPRSISFHLLSIIPHLFVNISFARTSMALATATAFSISILFKLGCFLLDMLCPLGNPDGSIL